MIKKISLLLLLGLLPLSLSSCGNNSPESRVTSLPTPIATEKTEPNFSDIFRGKVESVVRKVNVRASLEGATIDQALFDKTKAEIFGNEKNDFIINFTAPDSIKASGTVSTSFCKGDFSLSVSYEAKFKCIDTTKE